MTSVEPSRVRRGRVLPRLDQRRRRWLRAGLITALALVLTAWAAAPALRAVTLVGNHTARSVPDARGAGLPVQEVHFTATDGVRLAGWLAIASPDAPTIILVHG